MNKVGNQLREKRESLGLTVDDVVNQTKIQKVYVDAIEKNDLSFFQSQEFYQQVFIGRYADFLSMDKNAILSALQDDRNEYTLELERKEKEHKEKQSLEAKDLLPKEPLIPKQYKRAKTTQPVEETTPELTVTEEIENEDIQIPEAEINESIVPEVEDTTIDVESDDEIEEPKESATDTEFSQLLEEINQNVDENVEFETEEVQEENENKKEPIIYDVDSNLSYDDNFFEDEDVTKYNAEVEMIEEQEVDHNVDDSIMEETDTDGDFIPTYDDVYMSGSESEYKKHVPEELKDAVEEVETNQINEDEETELLNSSIFEDIEKINQEVEATRNQPKEVVEDVEEISTYSKPEPQTFDFDKLSSSLQHTQIIDLTKGIDLEEVTTPLEVPEEEIVEEVVEVEQPAKDEVEITEEVTEVIKPVHPIFTQSETKKEDPLEETTKLDDIVSEKGLDQSNTSELEQILSEKTKPRSNTDAIEETKQMKVAKALGDKDGINDDIEAAKIKRAKIIDTVLIVLIILLLCYLFYLLISNNIFN